MRDGRIEQVGTPDELYNRPINTFVAGFIGSPSMNLAQVDIRNGLIHTGEFAALGELVSQLNIPLGAATLGIRPEDMELNPQDADTASCLPVTVRLIEPTGAEYFLVCDSPFGEVTAVHRGALTVRPGDKAMLRIKPEKVHLFDPVSTIRIVNESLAA